MFIIKRQRLPIKWRLIGYSSQLRLISSDRGNNTELDDKILNEWKQGIQKREELKKSMESEERSRFIEEKKKELDKSKVKDLPLKETLEEPLVEPQEDKLKISGSYNDLMKKIKENENFQQLKDELKKYGENTPERSKTTTEHLAERLKNNAEELKRAFPIILRIINDLTGYTKVEKLKQDIQVKESTKDELKKELAVAKSNYNKSIELRSMSQKQVNELLQRQNTWSLQDLERFTDLYKNDHVLEKKEHENLKILQDLEQKMDENDDKLTTSILTRYHEEQIWSDKIRKFSTWGTIILMSVNVVLFVLVQLVFEPFKRKRLVNAFEEKVKVMLEQNKFNTTLAATSVATEVPVVKDPITQTTVSDPDLQKIAFSIPQFDKNNITKFFTELFHNLKTNFSKIFLTGPAVLTINKLQLDALLGISFLLSFSLGLLI